MKLFLTNLQSHWFSIDYGEGLDKGFFMSYICKREDTENTKPMDFKKIACTAVRRWNEKRMAGRAKDVPRCYAAGGNHCSHSQNRRGQNRNHYAEAHIRSAAHAKRPQDSGSKGCSKRNAFPKSRQPRVCPQRFPRRTIRVPLQHAHRSHGVLPPV